MNKVELHCKKKILAISYVTWTNCVAFLTHATETTQHIRNKVAINKLRLNKYYVQYKASVASEFTETFLG